MSESNLPMAARRRARLNPVQEERKTPYSLQPVAWDRHPTERGHISIGDATEPSVFCGRSCLFAHAASTNLNMEHAERVTKKGFGEDVRRDEHVIETDRGHNGDYAVGMAYYHTEPWEHESRLDEYRGKCDHCGGPVDQGRT